MPIIVSVSDYYCCNQILEYFNSFADAINYDVVGGEALGGGWDVPLQCGELDASVPRDRVCDGVRDCSNGKDEQHCFVPRRVRRDAKEMKTLTLWQCVNGDFIDRESLCDGKVNCGDASDEDPAVCSYLPCPISLWRCAYTGQCIKKAYVCDGETQCKDDSDENGYMCKMWPCTTMKCLINDTINNITDPVCLHAGQMCDGNFDCLDKKDEFDCNDTLEMPCSPLHVRCPTSSQCVSVMEMCKGKQYCMGDGEKLMCNQFNCRWPELHYLCKYKMCVPRIWLCHFNELCEDGYNWKPKNLTLTGGQ